MTPGLKIDDDEIRKILTSGVVKREIQEGEKADKARAQVKKAAKKKMRKRKKIAAS
jgi:hypothetical protein